MNEYAVKIKEYFGNPVYDTQTKVVIMVARTGREAVKRLEEEHKWFFDVLEIKKL